MHKRESPLSIHIKKLPGWLLALSAGLLSVLAFPPLPLGFLAYFALIPLLFAFEKDDFHLGFEKGFLFGLILNLGILYWLALNKGTTWYFAFLSMFAGVLFLTLAYGITGWLIGFIGRRLSGSLALYSLPVLWIAMEFLRSFGSLGFTWNNLCYTQSYAVPLIQLSAITSAYGMSGWIVAVNLIIYAVIKGLIARKNIKKQLILLGLLFLIPESYGLWVMRDRPVPDGQQRPVKVGVVQPNVDPTQKWAHENFSENMQLLYQLTDSIMIHEPVDLVVWPETATPTYLRRNYRYTLDKIRAKISDYHANLLTGAPDYTGSRQNGYQYYNATFLISSHQDTLVSYRKIRLVPFGEYIPLSELYPRLNDLNMGQGNFTAGEKITLFKIPLSQHDCQARDTTLCFISAVCYESTFPSLLRKGVRQGAEMLVVVTNDAWFGHTSAPYLHAEIARFRAIENRVPLVRSANTGISLVYDRYGRRLVKRGFGQQDWFSQELFQGSGDSLYVKWGDFLAWICVGLSVCVALSAIFRKGKR